MGLHPNIPDSFWKPITDYLERKSQNQPFTKVHWLSLKNKFVKFSHPTIFKPEFPDFSDE